jgi:hypothetical protein
MVGGRQHHGPIRPVGFEMVIPQAEESVKSAGALRGVNVRIEIAGLGALLPGQQAAAPLLKSAPLLVNDEREVRVKAAAYTGVHGSELIAFRDRP